MQNRRYLLISSSDRKSGSPTDFMAKLNYSTKFDKCELINVFIPNTYYNITESNNKILINGIVSPFPIGNYTLEQFFSQFLITYSAVVNDITFNDISQKITISSAAGFNLSFPITGSMHEILGFDKNSSVFINVTESLYPPSIIQQNVFIEIEYLSSNQMSTNNYSSYTFIIPNDSNKNSIITFNNKTNYQQFINNMNTVNHLFNLNVRLKNKYGEILQGLNEWSLILSFY